MNRLQEIFSQKHHKLDKCITVFIFILFQDRLYPYFICKIPGFKLGFGELQLTLCWFASSIFALEKSSLQYLLKLLLLSDFILTETLPEQR